MTKSDFKRDAPRLLLVEPDVTVRSRLAAYLRECGYQVIEAATDAEARVVLATAEPDVLLIDFANPDRIDGFGLARWVRECGLGTKIILASSLLRVTADAAQLCDDGPAGRQPFDHGLLLDRIRRDLAARET